jgi:adenylate cyclase class 2
MDGGDRTERELKFRCADLEEFRQRLQATAERVSTVAFEDNILFDRNGELAGRGVLLRLRRDGHGACLTFKGVARFEDGLKVREERETRVGDADELQAVLSRLGYEPVQRYQKYREEWRLGSVVICLDRTPVGDFVEFEGSAAAAVAEQLGMDLQRAERLSYLELYREHRRENPSAPEDMIFL